MIRIVIVDDHTMVRHLMRDTLSEQEGMAVVADYDNGEDFLADIDGLAVDIAIIDIGLPDDDGVEVTRHLRERGIEIPVLCLTMYLNDAVMQRAFDAGANGYAVKHDAFDILADGIRTVASGGRFLSPAIEEVSSGPVSDEAGLLKKLSGREREIVGYVASSWTASEIADHLSISARTVDYHRRNIAEKTGLRRIADIVKFAVAVGIKSDQ